jgi:hypothetical protein
MGTTGSITKDKSKRAWLIENQLNPLIADLTFQSTITNFAIVVSVMPPDWPPAKPYVKLDRRDRALWSSVVGDFRLYDAADFPGTADLYVGDALRALRQIPDKYLLANEAEIVAQAFEKARCAYHLKEHGALPTPGRTPPSSSARHNEPAPELKEDHREQIVVQWPQDAELRAAPAFAGYGDEGMDTLLLIEALLAANSNGLYAVDGHDVGSGTCNFFVVAENRDAAVERLIALARTGELPKGVRIGVHDAGETSLRAVFPKGLGHFSLMGD